MTDGRSLVTIGSVADETHPQTAEAATGRSIVVNGRACTVRSDDIGFDQVVGLAFAGEEPSSARSLSVTYRRGPAVAAEGILVPTQRTPILGGETFIVTRTDKS
jgi:hypothetical protein